MNVCRKNPTFILFLLSAAVAGRQTHVVSSCVCVGWSDGAIGQDTVGKQTERINITTPLPLSTQPPHFKTSPSEHPFKVPREGVTICRVHVTTTSVPAAGGIDHSGGGDLGTGAGWGTVHILGFIKLTHQPSWPGEMMG